MTRIAGPWREADARCPPSVIMFSRKLITLQFFRRATIGELFATCNWQRTTRPRSETRTNVTRRTFSWRSAFGALRQPIIVLPINSSVFRVRHRAPPSMPPNDGPARRKPPIEQALHSYGPTISLPCEGITSESSATILNRTSSRRPLRAKPVRAIIRHCVKHRDREASDAYRRKRTLDRGQLA